MIRLLCRNLFVLFITAASLSAELVTGTDTLHGAFDFTDPDAVPDSLLTSNDIDIISFRTDPSSYGYEAEAGIQKITGTAFDSILVAPESGYGRTITITGDTTMFVAVTREGYYVKALIYFDPYSPNEIIMWAYQTDSSRLLAGGSHTASTYHPFPDSDAVWNIEITNIFDSDTRRTLRYCAYGDTVINTLTYHKIYSVTDDTLFNPLQSELWTLIREDSLERVYVLYNDSTEDLLYDFGALPGDTVRHAYYFMPWNTWPDPVPEGIVQIVTGIDSVLCESEYRRVLLFDYGDSWIEGIGSRHGLFHPVMAYPSNGDSYYFTCFKNDGSVVYRAGSICDRCFCSIESLVGIKLGEMNAGHTVTMYKRIYSLSGEVVNFTEMARKPAGIYICVEYSGGECRVTKRISVDNR